VGATFKYENNKQMVVSAGLVFAFDGHRHRSAHGNVGIRRPRQLPGPSDCQDADHAGATRAEESRLSGALIVLSHTCSARKSEHLHPLYGYADDHYRRRPRSYAGPLRQKGSDVGTKRSAVYGGGSAPLNIFIKPGHEPPKSLPNLFDCLFLPFP